VHYDLKYTTILKLFGSGKYKKKSGFLSRVSVKSSLDFHKNTNFIFFDERSPSTNLEAVKDLVGDNPGPLAELLNLDKGCWVVPLRRDTPDTDNAEIQSSSWARDSSS
jgi:hypothetical protein